MISHHKDRSHNTRVPPDIGDAASRQLEDRGWTVFEYLRACLNAAATNPDAAVAFLGPYRLPRKSRGRPRKAGPDTT